MKKNLLKIFAVLLGISLGACLNDTKYALDPSGSKNIIEFFDPSVPSNPAGAIYPVWTSVTEIVPEFEFDQEISFSGPNANSEDIVLTLAVDPLALEAYNQQMVDGLQGSTYEMMPQNYYAFDDFTVTIPKGQTRATISVKVFPGLFDLTKNFALPLRIVSASSGIISAHFSVAILAVVVKNKYDGIYDILGGQVTRLVGGVQDAALGGEYNDGLQMSLATVNGNTVGITPLWKDGSNIGGVTGTQFSIDETTNLVTVSATGNSTLKNIPATINAYNPVDQTFEVSFTWSTPGTREVKNLKIKYNKPRP